MCIEKTQTLDSFSKINTNNQSVYFIYELNPVIDWMMTYPVDTYHH